MPHTLFLHIGKTGGTALRDMFQRHAAVCGAEAARLLPHSYTLGRAAAEFAESTISFNVRDPVSRSVSAFWSRYRCGRPRYDVPWRPPEAAAFRRYPSPEALGLGLAAGEPEAEQAWQAIFHLAADLRHYLGSVAQLQEVLPRIRHIGRQETLSQDMPVLRAEFGLAAAVGLPQDDIARHATPPGFATTLSPVAHAAIAARCAADYPILDWCLAWRRERGLP